MVEAVSVAVVGGIAEEAFETVENVEGGVGEFASESAGAVSRRLSTHRP
jgi:hypothetical protein